MKVGIVIPSYNQAKWICRAISSVRCQEYKDWELLVLDGASIDGSIAEAEKARCHDSRITIRSVPFNHMDGKLNIGFGVQKSEYMTWLCTDDYWKPNFLNEMVKILDNDKSIDIVHSAYDEVSENQHGSLNVKAVVGEEVGPYQEFLHCNNIGIFWLFRRALWNTVGIFQRMSGEDHDWTLRAYEAGAKFKLAPMSLACRWIHAEMFTARSGERGMEDIKKNIIALANKRGKGELCKK